MKVDLPATIFDEAKALSFRAGGGVIKPATSFHGVKAVSFQGVERGW